jgi:dTDP-4-dehydrorhamnose 3,5-epimerase
MSPPESPHLIEGGISVDDRGELAFCNAATLGEIRRFYTVSNHSPGRIRAWHGHRREMKMVWPLSGTALVGAVAIDDWEHPSGELPVCRYVLSSLKPSLLIIPAGHANGFMSLTSDTKLLFLSTSTLEESSSDDIRFAARYWDPWHVVDR